MARTAADLVLLFDVIAGPDEPDAAGYRLALPPSRHDTLAGFRALVLDTHPLLPTGQAVSRAIERFAERLAKGGCTIARSSPLLPDLALGARLYMQLLTAFQPGADMPIEDYRRIRDLVAPMQQEDVSLATMRLRGTVMSHRDWIGADRIRAGIRQQWRELFSAFDVVVCPIMPTPAFPHNHGPRRERQIEIDGKLHPYDDQLVWPGVATMPGLPSTTAPIDRSASGLPIGIQIIGPYLEDRTTLAFARLIEREFGGLAIPTALQATK